MQSTLPEELKMKTTLFKVCTLGSVLWATGLMVGIKYFFGAMSEIGQWDEFSYGFFIAMGITSLSSIIIAAAGMYNLYFLAKSFKTAELREKVTFGQFVGEFFLMWFFSIVGVFILQPKINEIAARHQQ